MFRTLLATLLILAASAPTAEAGLFSSSITVGTERVGDHGTVEVRMDADGEVEAHHLVYQVEGPSTAVDAYGRTVDTVAYRLDVYDEDGELASAMRCHRLARGADGVRTEFLADFDGADGYSYERGGPIMGSRTMEVDGTVLALFSANCPASALDGRTLSSGDRLPLGQLLQEELPEALDGALSRPARGADFHGLDALEFVFDLRDLLEAAGEEVDEDADGTLRFVLAEGIPGVAMIQLSGREGEDRIELTAELVGFVAGTGPEVPRGSDTMPERHPDATFAVPDALRLDVDALELTFPYDDAFAAILADPQAGLGEWLAEHPDARLALAIFTTEAEMEVVGTLQSSSDGAWLIQLEDANDVRAYLVQRLRGAAVGPLDLPAARSPIPMDVVSEVEMDARGLGDGELAVVDSATIRSVLEAQGIDAGTIGSLGYVSDAAFGRPFLNVQQLPVMPEEDGEGLGLYLDLASGRAGALMTRTVRTTQEGGILPLAGPEERIEPASVSAFSALSKPVGFGSLVATAAGLGLLALVVKVLLLPLYSRLRRDRLLDNPVRARLYDRVRTEPGVHRAELVDFAGIGEGATRHHLQQLVHHGLLAELSVDGYARYYAAGEVPPEVARREATLRAGSQRAVYELYAREPSLSLREAALRLGMSAPSVHRAKKKLEASGLLPAAPASEARVAEA